MASMLWTKWSSVLNVFRDVFLVIQTIDRDASLVDQIITFRIVSVFLVLIIVLSLIQMEPARTAIMDSES